MTHTRHREPRIVIIGAGMAGIAAAHTFKQAGFNDFVILEKGSDVGGVWHWNRYPGLRCDVMSHGYQFAFAPKPDWKDFWATGEEIQQYHRDVVGSLQLDHHLRLDCEVISAVFGDNRWRVTTADDSHPRFPQPVHRLGPQLPHQIDLHATRRRIDGPLHH